jgi:hypothetical protein
MTSIEIPEEALSIAIDAAGGMSVRDWVVKAISDQAAAQDPSEEIPYDDAGFYSPLRLVSQV